MSAQEIAERRETGMTMTQADNSPMQMLQTAITNKMDPAVIKDLMDLRDRWEAGEARKQYMEAIAAFKKNPPVVIKDMLNKQYGSRYSSLANLVNTVNESMSVFGLNARWDFEQNEKITVTCILSHVAGHSERVSLSGQPDTSGSKNPIQQVKSTITYLKGATFEAITGIASRDGNADDDGNGASVGAEKVSKGQAANIEALITEIGEDCRKGFLKYMKVNSVEDIAVQAYDDAIKALNKKRAAK